MVFDDATGLSLVPRPHRWGLHPHPAERRLRRGRPASDRTSIPRVLLQTLLPGEPHPSTPSSFRGVEGASPGETAYEGDDRPGVGPAPSSQVGPWASRCGQESTAAI